MSVVKFINLTYWTDESQSKTPVLPGIPRTSTGHHRTYRWGVHREDLSL